MAENLPLKVVNLGNWLVAEKWMEPSLFDGIVNDDLLDGTQIWLKSTKVNKYLTAEDGGGSLVVANREEASDWETFRFVQKDQNARVVAVNNVPGGWETFEIERKAEDRNRIRIKASNGLYLQVQSDTMVSADYGGSGWEDSNPSVFIMTKRGELGGEYQLTYGLGPDKALQRLQEHRNTYITEEDFRFMSSNGLNAVRIPVGWWIAFDPYPPKPFVGGSLPALDNAFSWAQKYGMKVIVDLHAAQGSQNGWDHSATRDGVLEWGDAQISDTVAVIDFLAKRYANHPSLIAIELMNEPSTGVNLDTLTRYYKAGYDAVRKYTSTAYVILSNRVVTGDKRELFSLASGLNRVVIDVHYYNYFFDGFRDWSAQQNIDIIYNDRSAELGALIISNGPLVFVGEWSGAGYAFENGASAEDQKRFLKAQLDVFGRATFGWAYWSCKTQDTTWNLKWLIENNYIKL
ncbi:hypothetical protein TIFTF001_004295 [Ficus carica]|uniref:Mannan endo-1,4-beta-mannosidase n=1 Tax=Ficus carica TaxID=3494 RepID=A0AA87ZUS0_FICCA|nr:hypothetical protein TIFTF001_004295 [Ficus carica]